MARMTSLAWLPYGLPLDYGLKKDCSGWHPTAKERSGGLDGDRRGPGFKPGFFLTPVSRLPFAPVASPASQVRPSSAM
jgi:hypothetical protein